MPGLPPQAPPAQPDAVPPPWSWRSAVEHQTRRLVDRCRPGSDDPEIRRRVVGIAFEVIGMRPAPPPLPPAPEGPPDARLHQIRAIERYRLILACHPEPWGDGRPRLEFLSEVIRVLDLTLGRETATAHPEG